MNPLVYADNAATTKMLPEVFEAMTPYLNENYGNPSSMYRFGQVSRIAVDRARDSIAKNLGCLSAEVFFTSGGTESDNWAIKMVMQSLAAKGKNHLIISAFEHHAVLHTAKHLEKLGFEVTLLPVYSNGIVKVEDVKNSIKATTGLVSVMLANNEIGTIQPIKEIADVCRQSGVLMFSDAVQAVGHIPVNFAELGVDMLAFSGHKFHGPKGVGGLIVRKGLRFPNLLDGGAQEKNRRASTENVASIVGMATALEAAMKIMDSEVVRQTAMRNRLIDGLLSTVSHSRLNGDAEHRLPGNVNISFEGIEGESLLMLLDYHGICASSGSACTSGSLDPSHVLLAIGLVHAVAHGSLRLTFSHFTTDEDIDIMLEKIPPVVQHLREMSPVWEKVLRGEQYE